MYQFPKDLYTDVRLEQVFTTKIRFHKEDIIEQKVRGNNGAFIRMFDGNRWYYSSVTEKEQIQATIDELAKMATPNPDILDNPIVAAYEVHDDTSLIFEDDSVTDIPVEEKKELVQKMIAKVDHPLIVNYYTSYVDHKAIKEFYSSKGSSIKFDQQFCGARMTMDLIDGEKKDEGYISKGKTFFHELEGIENDVVEEIKKAVHFVQNAEQVDPGVYTVLFSPVTTGVFTHESFGHKSESDFMIGDEAMKAEWVLGKEIGKPLLSIIDSGLVPGNGYTMYDDEGTLGRENYIIKNGILNGRLHSAHTAAVLEEGVTGNARAMNFEYEPLVRMTTTYIGKGETPVAEIIAGTEKGIYVETFKHGSGMSTFTIAPQRAHMIENGKITRPVKVSVITGSVFQALNDIDALSEEFELFSFVGGGCGKMEQFPLPVGFGGPYMRVNNLNVQ